MDDKQFYRDLRVLRDKFVQDVADLCVKYGTELIPLSFDDVFNFWNPALEKLIDKDFRQTIERKVKSLKKELNPLWRRIRGWFGK